MKIHFIAWYIFLSILDITTTLFLLALDPTIEANPLGVALFSNFGPLGLVAGKLVSIGIVSFCIYNLQGALLRTLVTLGLGIMGLVVLNNTINLYVGLGVI